MTAEEPSQAVYSNATRVPTASSHHLTGHRWEKDKGPDILVGYSHGYRSSWDSPLGMFPREVFVDNRSAWSGDHCVDNRLVPGILVTNQNITSADPSLADLMVSVLDEFGIKPPGEVIGEDILEAKN